MGEKPTKSGSKIRYCRVRVNDALVLKARLTPDLSPDEVFTGLTPDSLPDEKIFGCTAVICFGPAYITYVRSCEYIYIYIYIPFLKLTNANRPYL